jgi:hypothetical protein
MTWLQFNFIYQIVKLQITTINLAFLLFYQCKIYTEIKVAIEIQKN